MWSFGAVWDCCPTDLVSLSLFLLYQVLQLLILVVSGVYFGFIMSSCSKESFGVRFTRKNYSAWEFQFQFFVTGKELWGHIDDSDPAPTEPKELAKWKVMDARGMSWILGAVDPLIVLNLRPYKTAKTMWEYLLKVYD